MGNTVDFLTYHLNYSKSSKFNNYSSIYSKSFVSNINSQIIRFIIILTKGFYLKKKILFSNHIKINNCSISNFYNNWWIFIHGKDVFLRNKFKKKKFKKNIIRWKYSFKKIFFKFLYPKKIYYKNNIKPFSKIKKKFKKISIEQKRKLQQEKRRKKYLKKLKKKKQQKTKIYHFYKKLKKKIKQKFKRVLIYLKFLYFKFPSIIALKVKIRNFILVNFFKFKFNNFFNPKIFFLLGLNIKPTASLISLFIAKKLIHRYPINSILKKCFIYLKTHIDLNLISGFKILVAGRISRRDRAIYSWKRWGTISVSSKFIPIHYSKRLLKMRYGTSNIKVWIQQ